MNTKSGLVQTNRVLVGPSISRSTLPSFWSPSSFPLRSPIRSSSSSSIQFLPILILLCFRFSVSPAFTLSQIPFSCFINSAKFESASRTVEIGSRVEWLRNYIYYSYYFCPVTRKDWIHYMCVLLMLFIFWIV